MGAIWGVSQADLQHFERAGLVQARDRIPALQEVFSLKPDEVGRYDFAALNLVCATGLPRAEGLDVRKSLAVLDA